MDMAGFSVSVKLLRSRPHATFPAQVSFELEKLMSEESVSNFSLFSRCLTCLTRQGVLPRRGIREESRSGAGRTGAEGGTLY